MQPDTNPAIVVASRGVAVHHGAGSTRTAPWPSVSWVGLAVVALTTVWVILQNNGREATEPDAVVADFVLVSVPRIARVVEALVVGLGALVLPTTDQRP